MPNYDKDTKAFMDKVAGKEPPKPPEPPQLESERQVKDVTKALSTLRTLASRNPVAIINRAIGVPLAKKVLELRAPEEVPSFQKQGSAGLNVLEIYGHLNTMYKRTWWDWEPEFLG